MNNQEYQNMFNYVASSYCTELAKSCNSNNEFSNLVTTIESSTRKGVSDGNHKSKRYLEFCAFVKCTIAEVDSVLANDNVRQQFFNLFIMKPQYLKKLEKSTRCMAENWFLLMFLKSIIAKLLDTILLYNQQNRQITYDIFNTLDYLDIVLSKCNRIRIRLARDYLAEEDEPEKKNTVEDNVLYNIVNEASPVESKSKENEIRLQNSINTLKVENARLRGKEEMRENIQNKNSIADAFAPDKSDEEEEEESE